MITCSLESLPLGQTTALRQWLNKAELETLRTVIDAQVKFHQAKALEQALEASDRNAKLDAGNADLQAAQRYSVCLDVLQEFAGKTDFQIAKIN